VPKVRAAGRASGPWAGWKSILRVIFTKKQVYFLKHLASSLESLPKRNLINLIIAPPLGPPELFLSVGLQISFPW
jgi:hypothetical protein